MTEHNLIPPDPNGPPAGHIRVVYRKWWGALHWHFDTVDLGRDSHGRWLGVPVGTAMRRGLEQPRRSGGFVLLVPEDAWWTLAYNGPARHPMELYVDITTPAIWKEATVKVIDLDLDIARTAAGEVNLLDEDEFTDHAIEHGYPAGLVERARAVAAQLFLAVQEHAAPFDGTAEQWLRELILK